MTYTTYLRSKSGRLYKYKRKAGAFQGSLCGVSGYLCKMSRAVIEFRLKSGTIIEIKTLLGREIAESLIKSGRYE